jgi:hypothetical protein
MAIERYVLLKLHIQYATPEGRDEVVAESRRALSQVTGVRTVWVGVPADDASARSWDVAIRVTLDDVADIPAYLDDPVHRAYADEFLAPRVEFKKVWNFEPR